MNIRDLKARLTKAQDASAWPTNTAERATELEAIRDDAFAAMTAIMDSAEDENRPRKASENRQYDALEMVFDAADQTLKNGAKITDESRAQQMRGVIAPASAAAYRPGQPLAADQSFVGAMRALNGLDDGADDDSLSLQGYLRGALLGSWDASNAREREVFASLTGSSTELGGILIPSILTAEIIDAARAQTRVLQAGARLVPMANRKVTVPKWVSDPVPGWRLEGEAFASDDAEMGSMELAAKNLGVVTKATIELLEDTGIQGELEAALARSFAQVIDFAALYSEDDLDGDGDPVGRKPTGVRHTTGVNVQALATNGAAPTWAALVGAVGRLRDVNEDPTAQILSDRTARSLALLTDSNQNYVAAPGYLDGVTRYITNQVPNNLVVGTSGATTSDVFTADWSKLLVGVRSELRIQVLRERYLPDSGEIGFVATWRGDFGITRPKAFDVLTGVKAS